MFIGSNTGQKFIKSNHSIKKIKTILIKYYPDILIQIGIIITASRFFKIKETITNNPFDHNGGYSTIYFPDFLTIIGVILITVGLNIFIRKYFKINA